MKEARQESRKPPHASDWKEIRRSCERRDGKECRYPFCNCTLIVASNSGPSDTRPKGTNNPTHPAKAKAA